MMFFKNIIFSIVLSVHILNTNVIAQDKFIKDAGNRLKPKDVSVSGAVINKIPIHTPPAKGNINTELSILYNSYNKKENILGFSWTLNIDVIQRNIKDGFDADKNEFIITLNGESKELSLVNIETNTYAEKIEGNFTRYVYNNTSSGWTVTKRNGNKYYFGSTENSRLSNNNDEIYKWYLDKVCDTNKNELLISYKTNPLDLNNKELTVSESYNYYTECNKYIHKINYGSNQISFFYKVKPLNSFFVPTYEMHSPLYTFFLLEQVKINSKNEITKYCFEYEEVNSTNRISSMEIKNEEDDIIRKYQMKWSNNKLNTVHKRVYTNVKTSPPYTAYGDLDGDGRMDIIRYDKNDRLVYTYLTYDLDYFEPWSSGFGYYDIDDILTADMNNDGKDEAIFIRTKDQFLDHIEIEYYLFPEKGSKETDIITIDTSSDADEKFVKLLLGDINGDGFKDIICIYESNTQYSHNKPATTSIIYYKNIDGTEFVKSSLTIAAINNNERNRTKNDDTFDISIDPDEIDSAFDISLAEINGDRCADVIVHIKKRSTVTISKENKTELYYFYQLYCLIYMNSKNDTIDLTSINYIPISITNNAPDVIDYLCYPESNPPQGQLYNFQITDVNGDGLSDIFYTFDIKDLVRLDYTQLELLVMNNYNKKELVGFYSNGKGGFGSLVFYDSIPSHEKNYNITAIDITGDGIIDLDIDESEETDNYSYIDINGDGLKEKVNSINHYLEIFYWENSTPQHLLTSISDSLGATIIYSYTSSYNFDHSYLPFNTTPVSDITLDGISTSYSYSGGYYDIDEQEFRGFKSVTKINPNKSYEINTYYVKDKYFKGRPHLKQLYDPENILLSEKIYSYEVNDITLHNDTTKTKFVKLSSIAMNEDGIKWCETFDYWDGTDGNDSLNGYIKTQKFYSVLNPEITDKPVLKKEYNYKNCNNDWLWRIGKETLKGENSNTSTDIVRTTQYNYDDNGNLKKQESGIGVKSPKRIKTYQYYDDGLLKEETDTKGYKTKYFYDNEISAIYPSKVENHLMHTKNYEVFNHMYGKPIKVEDENKNTTDYIYDDLGRTRLVTYPDQGQVEFKYGDCANPRYVKKLMKENAGQQAVIRKYELHDSLNRLIQVAVPAGQDNSSEIKYSVIQYEYDNMGQLSKTKGPFLHKSDVTSVIQETDKEYPLETRAYDYLGRIKKIVKSSDEYGSITKTYNYSGYQTTITDFDRTKRIEKRDCLGRIIEITDSGNQTTSYRYSAANDLLSIERSTEGYITTFEYDTLGQRIKMSDPDMGVWSYQYDGNGNLIRQVYPDNMLAKTKETTYCYDLSAYGVGRLYSISNSDVTKTVNAYDEMGREKSVTKKIDKLRSHTTIYGYDLAGRLNHITYPDENCSRISYSYYQGSDFIERVYDSDTNYATITYNAFGKREQIDYGNEIKSIYTYALRSGRLDSIITSHQTKQIEVWQQEYDYYVTGDIKSITNTANEVYNYTYDSLHRLDKEVALIDYDYLPAGQIIAKKGNNTFDYTYNNEIHKHAVNSITINNQTWDYKYDKNGNMIEGPDLRDLSRITTREITYNAYNRPTQIKLKDGANETKRVDYLYDGEGIRAKKTTIDNEEIYYINDHYIQDNGEAKKYIFADDLRIAKVDNNGVTYYHKDHLGSTVLLTDQEGEVLNQTSYYPFGTRRSGSIDERHRYTDQEYDSETGLYNYNARLYDPIIGRFITPDPVIPNVYDSQSLDPYAYCRNNPLRYVDPSGKVWGVAVAAVAAGAFLYESFFTTPDLNAPISPVDQTYNSPGFQDVAVNYITGATITSAAVKHGAKEVAIEIYDEVVSYFTGGLTDVSKLAKSAPKNIKSLSQQADDLIPLNQNRNRVTLRSEKNQIDIDLSGAPHAGIETPHTKISPRNFQAPEKLQPAYNTSTKKAIYRPATQSDIRTVRKYLEHQ